MRAVLVTCLVCVLAGACAVLSPADKAELSDDAAIIAKCEAEGRACKADGGADCYATYDACMRDGGQR